MTLGNLLSPWLLLAGVLIALIYVERWIHSHLYGVGWVLTNNRKSATALYYVLLLPGVFVHEFTQYLVAGVLNVRIKRVIAWPEAQDDGTLRLNFVTVQKALAFQRAIIGAAPLATGLALVWVISNYILNLEEVLAALGKADLALLGAALRELGSTPDFYLWLYLTFAISNAMLPTPSDREGWPLALAGFGAILVFLVVIGVGEVLLDTFTGPVAHGVELLTTAFLTVLAVEIPAVIAIAFFEEIMERVTGRKFTYSQRPARGRGRQPGSAEPLPPGAALPSVYNLDLPLPDPATDAGPSPRRREPAPAVPATPLREPDRARPEAARPPAQRPATAAAPLPAAKGTPPPGSPALRPGAPEAHPSRQSQPSADRSAPSGSPVPGARPAAPSPFGERARAAPPAGLRRPIAAPRARRAPCPARS
ncbi:MAG: hypothetical protein M5U29_04445 [Anaerolineae bacterium]|nr:hypothetical protein [Anaerolineae bacterium]